MSTSDLENQLVETGFPGLFLYGERSLADRMWDNGKNKAALENIIFSGSASDYGKFLAAELLRKYEVPLNTGAADILAKVYATALQNTGGESSYHLSGNLWGFLYPLDDAGHLGKQFISFGDAAIPYLQQLLDDDNIVSYEGSQEATLGNQYQYRIKDFAAFYISKINNIPVSFYQDIDKRDQEIERLKTILNE